MKCNQCLVWQCGKCKFDLKNTTEGCDYPSAQIRKLLRLEKVGNEEGLKTYLNNIKRYNEITKKVVFKC